MQRSTERPMGRSRRELEAPQTAQSPVRLQTHSAVLRPFPTQMRVYTRHCHSSSGERGRISTNGCGSAATLTGGSKAGLACRARIVAARSAVSPVTLEGNWCCVPVRETRLAPRLPVVISDVPVSRCPSRTLQSRLGACARSACRAVQDSVVVAVVAAPILALPCCKGILRQHHLSFQPAISLLDSHVQVKKKHVLSISRIFHETFLFRFHSLFHKVF